MFLDDHDAARKIEAVGSSKP